MGSSTPGLFARTMHALSHAFPTPTFLTLPAAGVDISDASIKWLMLEKEKEHFKLSRFGELPLREGVVVSGAVRDVHALAEALREVKGQLGGVHFAHTALPEEAAYVFEMRVPEGSSRAQTLDLIEFEFEGRVPIPPEAAVFDFDRIRGRAENGTAEIGVAVFPNELAHNYDAAFSEAGLELLSLELEARSIARAITKSADTSVTLLVDFGRARTGLAVLKRGIPIFTSTVEVGGEGITRALVEKLSLTPEQAVLYRNEQGLFPQADAAQGLDAVVGIASALSDEIARHYHYWDTRRDERGERVTPLSRVVLVGGSSNLHGLTDYIAGRIQAPAVLGNVWTQLFSFDEAIPEIPYRESLQYGTAIGLALRSYIP